MMLIFTDSVTGCIHKGILLHTSLVCVQNVLYLVKTISPPYIFHMYGD